MEDEICGGLGGDGLGVGVSLWVLPLKLVGLLGIAWEARRGVEIVGGGGGFSRAEDLLILQPAEGDGDALVVGVLGFEDEEFGGRGFGDELLGALLVGGGAIDAGEGLVFGVPREEEDGVAAGDGAGDDAVLGRIRVELGDGVVEPAVVGAVGIGVEFGGVPAVVVPDLDPGVVAWAV